MKTILFAFCTTVLLFTSCSTKPPIHAQYEGEDLGKTAQIIRNNRTKAASLEIETTGKWQIFAGRTVESINFFKPILRGEDSGTFKLDVPDSVRSYFLLETEKGKAILAERHLPMTGGYNFRDLGGIKNKDGKHTKWGKIFRSDDLQNLTEADLKYLASIPIVSVVDFRSEEEIRQAPDTVPSTVKNIYKYSITPGNLSDIGDLSHLRSSDMDSFMIKMNILFVTDSTYRNRYKEFFALLQNEENIPLMFHCSAGKDRTGMGAALVLFALGVDEETVMDDYLSSNKYLGDKYAKYIAQHPRLKSLYQVKPEFLQAGIDQIKTDYGSVEGFLESELNVNLQKFREMYLYAK